MPLPPGQRSISLMSNIDKNGNFSSLCNKPSGKRPAASPAKGTNIKRSALSVITNKINVTSSTKSKKTKDKLVLQEISNAVKTRRSIRLNKDLKSSKSDNSKHISFKKELKRPNKKSVSPASSADSSPLRPCHLSVTKKTHLLKKVHQGLKSSAHPPCRLHFIHIHCHPGEQN